MAIINLRNFYYWYTQDEFVEVSDEVAEELFAGKRYEKTHSQRMRRNMSFYSLDRNDGIEASAQVYSTDNPEAIFDKMDRHCRLCCALNSLPEKQGRRVDAHFLCGMNRKEIAAAEGVTESSVNESIDRGLRAMKIFLLNFENCPVKCPQSDLISEG